MTHSLPYPSSLVSQGIPSEGIFPQVMNIPLSCSLRHTLWDMIRSYKNTLHRVSHSPPNLPALLLCTVVFTVLSFIIFSTQNKDAHKINWGYKDEKDQNLPFWIFLDIIPQSPLHFFIPRVKIFLGQWENALIWVSNIHSLC